MTMFRLFRVAPWALAVAAYAADPAVVLIFGPPSAGPKCELGSKAKTPAPMLLVKPKINGKEGVKLTTTVPGAADGLSGREYGNYKATDIKLVDRLVFNGKVWTGYRQGSPNAQVWVPDGLKFEKGTEVRFASLYNLVVEGESVNGRNKVKERIPLNQLWKIYPVPEGMPLAEVLYRHASEEGSLAEWGVFLDRAGSHRVAEAQTALRGTLRDCVGAAKKEFLAGDYRALGTAMQLAKRAVQLSQSAEDRQLVTQLEREEQGVAERIGKGQALARESRFDDALETWEPVAQYASTYVNGDFAEQIAAAKKGSHDQHLKQAEAHAKGGASRGLQLSLGEQDYQSALKAYETALVRMPGSVEASRGKKDMEVKLALIHSGRHRGNKEPAKARDVLQKLLAVYKDEPALLEELRTANCETAAQLFDEARKAVASPLVAVAKAPAPAKPAAPAKPGLVAKKVAPAPAVAAAPAPAVVLNVRPLASPAEKPVFRQAREKLIEAVGLCPSEPAEQMLAKLNRVLADYHLAQAARAKTKRLPATAMLHLLAAQTFLPDHEKLAPELDPAREAVARKTRIQAGVVLRDASGRCGAILDQLRADAEAGLTASGASNVQLVDGAQTVGILQGLRGGRANDQLYAIVSGEVRTCLAGVTPTTRSVPSRTVRPNPNYPAVEEQRRAADAAFNQCKDQNQGNEANCQYQKQARDQARSRQSNTPRELYDEYTYQETAVRYQSQLSVLLQIDDAVAKGTRSAGDATASLTENCVERHGVRSNDAGSGNAGGTGFGPGKSGFLGNLLSGLAAAGSAGRTGLSDSTCPRPDANALVQQTAVQLQKGLQEKVSAALAAVPQGLFDSARRSTDADQALEQYIAFALVSASRASGSYQQAVAAIRERDSDLKPELMQ